MATGALMRCIDDDEWDVAVDVGGGVRMLQATDPAKRWLVEHACKTVYDYQLVIAPGLDPAHVVHSVDPLTITASLSCPDCGLHGWVTDGHWVPC